MRLHPLLLAGSLVANGLLFAHWRGWTQRAPELPPPSVAPAPLAVVAAPSVIDPATWSAYADGGDPATLVARLRAKGFPPRVLRAIVQAHVRERHAPRLAPLLAQVAAEPFWKDRFGANRNVPLALAQRALEREIDEEIQRVLGPDDNPALGYVAVMKKHQYGSLAREKIREIERILDDYSDLRGQVNTEARGVLLPEDREKLALLEKERWSDIARLLTPAEFEDYELRSSTTSNRLRGQVAAFEPTEAEYRALFHIHQQLDREFGRMETLTPDLRQKRNEAEKLLAPQIAAALGPERFADFHRTTDPAWLQASRFVQQQSLAPAVTGQLAAIQQDITRRADALREDRKLPVAQRNAQLAILEQEATARLTPVLGDRVLNDYRGSGGYWLRTLKPSSPP